MNAPTKSPVLFQLCITFVVIFCIYMGFAVLKAQAALVELFEFVIIQPLLGALCSAATIVICFVAGLPIRGNERLYKWWFSHPSVPLSGIGISIVLFALSLYPPFMDSHNINIANETVTHNVPNHILSITGWFIVTFCLLHLYPGAFKKREQENSPH